MKWCLILLFGLCTVGSGHAMQVSLNQTSVSCGATNIEATFDCNFNGFVDVTISGGVNTAGNVVSYEVENGQTSFFIEVQPSDNSPFTITFETTSTDLGCAVLPSPFSSATLSHTCVAGTNDNCATAAPLTVNYNTCSFSEFDVNNSTESGVIASCGSSGLKDLWYSFEANDIEVWMNLGSLPGTFARWAAYSGCAANSEIACGFTTPNTSDIKIGGLTDGNTYYIQVQIFSFATGDQQICLYDNSPSNANAPLPIELGSFEASLVKDNQAIIEWEIFSSINTERLNLLRKRKQDEKYISVFEMKLEDHSDLRYYKFEDNNLDFQETYYYVLQTTNTDGTQDLSHTISVETAMNRNKNITLIYPNPTRESLVFNYPSYLPKEDLVDINIYSLTGASVKNITFSDHDEYKLDISELENGTYILEYRSGISRGQKLFIKI